jgi:hypothetical protein
MFGLPGVASAGHIPVPAGAADALVVDVANGIVTCVTSAPEGGPEELTLDCLPPEQPPALGPLTAYLLERGTRRVTDEIVFEIEANGNIHVTLTSDPLSLQLSCPSNLNCVEEDGTMQHMNAYLDPSGTRLDVNDPVQIYAFSDIPEPGSAALVALGLAGLRLGRVRRRLKSKHDK